MKRTLFFVCVLFLAWPSNASIIIWNEPHDGPYRLYAFFEEPTAFAYDFVVGDQDISVSSLGVYDVHQDGLLESHDVSIWTAEGTPVASVTVPDGEEGVLFGNSRHAELATPVTLQSGDTYVIGTWYSDMSDEPFTWEPWDPAGHEHFESLAANSAWFASGSLAFPPALNGNGPYLGTTFGYNIVPEPSTYILFVLGGLIIAIAARRRIREKE